MAVVPNLFPTADRLGGVELAHVPAHVTLSQGVLVHVLTMCSIMCMHVVVLAGG